MKGSYEVVVQNARVQFKFVISRNLTILRGDSATGKTTLIDMISEYDEMGKSSGVELRCEKPCRVLSGRTWKAVLQTIRDSIVFIDEGNEFVRTEEFAHEIQKTDNYYVIATRASLFMLPYSVNEVYFESLDYILTNSLVLTICLTCGNASKTLLRKSMVTIDLMKQNENTAKG